MADFEVEEPLIEFATANYLAAVAIIFSVNVVDVSEEVLFGASYLGTPPLVMTANSVRVDEDVLFGSFYSTLNTPGAGGNIRTYTRAFVIEELVLPYVAGDNTQRIIYNVADTVTPSVPTPAAGGYELIYPIVPRHDADVVLNQADSVKWSRLQLTAVKGFNLLRYRIRRPSVDAMVGFFETNRGNLVELYTPAIRPFGNNYTRSNVRVVNYMGYLLEEENLFQVDVLYQFVGGIA
jgi:hypothetical protein